MGKCVDLESAYKQCPVAQKHSHVSVFALKNPESGEVEFFEVCALPFGATAAVHGFNRCATALNHTAHHVIAAPCSHYFDDFTLIAPKALGERMSEKVIALFEVLGWKVKKEKDLPMEDVFVALGSNSIFGNATPKKAASRSRTKRAEWRKSRQGSRSIAEPKR